MISAAILASSIFSVASIFVAMLALARDSLSYLSFIQAAIAALSFFVVITLFLLGH